MISTICTFTWDWNWERYHHPLAFNRQHLQHAPTTQNAMDRQGRRNGTKDEDDLYFVAIYYVDSVDAILLHWPEGEKEKKRGNRAPGLDNKKQISERKHISPSMFRLATFFRSRSSIFFASCPSFFPSLFSWYLVSISSSGDQWLKASEWREKHNEIAGRWCWWWWTWNRWVIPCLIEVELEPIKLETDPSK